MPLLRSILGGMVTVLAVWQLAIWAVTPPRFMLPAPLDVLKTLFIRHEFLFGQAWITLVEIVLGLLFGSLAGIAVALLVTAFPRFGNMAWPSVLVLQALPVFAIAPLLVLWFGFGLASKVVMASLIIFFPIASAFADGIRRTHRDLLDAAALTQATSLDILWLVRVPSALPSLVSGFKMAAVFAPIGAVIGEWVGSSAGLGFVMLQANARMQADVLFAALAILAAMTLILRFTVDELTARIAPWARHAPHHY
ncbi:MAG: ABC transporter permease [Phyllobacterium sp.]